MLPTLFMLQEYLVWRFHIFFVDTLQLPERQKLFRLK